MSTASAGRIHRPARRSYIREQKFFIVNGLTSVYYHVRKDWGMKRMLKSQSYSVDDRRKIEDRAAHFSRDFLAELGYFDRADS